MAVTRLSFAPKWFRRQFMPRPENVIIVAKRGPAHARTINEALSLVKNPSTENPWLIEVMPGIYEEQITRSEFQTGVTIRGIGGLIWDTSDPIVVLRLPSGADSHLIYCDGGNLIGMKLEANITGVTGTFSMVEVRGVANIIGCWLYLYGSSDANARVIVPQGTTGHLWLVNSSIRNRVNGSGNHYGIYIESHAQAWINGSDIRVDYSPAIGIYADKRMSYAQIRRSFVEVPSGQTLLDANKQVLCYDVSWSSGGLLSGTYTEHGLAEGDKAGRMPSSMYNQLSSGSGVSGTFTTADGKTITVTDGIVTSIV